jgi:hypothetical protein
MGVEEDGVAGTMGVEEDGVEETMGVEEDGVEGTMGVEEDGVEETMEVEEDGVEETMEDGVLLTSAVVGVEAEEEEVEEGNCTWDFAPTWKLSCVRIMLCSMTGHAWS